MLPVVEIPLLVRHYSPFFESVFSERGFQQFQRYLSGLLISENKTVEGINRIFVLDKRHPSSLNRFLSGDTFPVEAVNDARLGLLATQKKTVLKPKGVLILDDTLLTHYGKHFEKIAKLYDPVSRSYVWAHNLVNLHYSDQHTDYPVYFKLWEPVDLEGLESGLKAAGIRLRESKYDLKKDKPDKWRSYLLGVWQRRQNNPEVSRLYKSKLIIGQELLSHYCQAYPDLSLPVTFDSWYTKPPFCRFIDEVLKLAYVGTLGGEDQVIISGEAETLDSFDKKLQQAHQAALQEGEDPIFREITIAYKGQRETYYSYCKTHHISTFGKQRLVINHQKADLSDGATFYISNKLRWQSENLTRIRRHRWPVEVYHEEGKADGLSEYQVRDFKAIYNHIALVALAYSLFRAAQHDRQLLLRLQHNVQKALDRSAGAWRRNVQAQALWSLACFFQAAFDQGQTVSEVMHPLLACLKY